MAKKDNFKLCQNGTIVDRRKLSCEIEENEINIDKRITLRHIVSDFCSQQHMRCSNPVVTVPQFSLFKLVIVFLANKFSLHLEISNNI